ncbi:MAG: metallophosphoesterase [Candidatus Thiodiazotropha sp. (ex Epidulcina cf. delphinae)]|nr:metallophosphoesterase [Candidatus Thiodiazotropha sp. (ex Epidulcina cf. delphinae)]
MYYLRTGSRKLIEPSNERSLQTMAQSGLKSKKSLIKLLKKAFSGLSQCEEVELEKSYRLHGSKIKVPIHCHPLQINLPPDGKALHLYPESLTHAIDDNRDSHSFIVFDPETYYSEISGFFRIEEGEKLIIGSDDKERQKAFLNISSRSGDYVFSISNEEGHLIFRDYSPRSGSCISPMLKDKKMVKVATWRGKKLKRLLKIFGGEITTLAEKEALSLLRDVNRVLADEAFREKDESSNPGGVIRLPDTMTPFIIGDLHGKVDNLLVVLSQNGFLEALEQGTACLVMLGDAVHCEEEGRYHEMEDSILIMDVILRLKQQFPEQVFYLRGNHDSFSDEIAKGGVAQGLLWKKTLNKTRGKEYRKEIERFYDLLPYAAYSKDMICCHAAPPTSKVTLETLINIKRHAGLIKELNQNRLQKASRPGGYNKRDVKRFRKVFDLPADTPVIVGHTPVNTDDTLWTNVGEIENHYVVYGGNNDWVGVMSGIGDKMYPLIYPVEPLLDYINQLSDSP